MIIGSARKHYEKVSSTNTVANEMLRHDKPVEGTVITASYQECGRGQIGARWESEPGKNLLMSVILYPVMVRPEEQFFVSEMVSLAVCDLVRQETPHVKIKWPNDIYVINDKIAGILIEHSVMGSVLSSSVAGIGLNVNQITFTEGAPNAVSLTRVTGRDYNLTLVTDELIRLLDKRYKMIVSGNASLLAEEYNDALFRRHEWHRYADSEGAFTGTIEGVKPDGQLMVKRQNGVMTSYSFKEIDYIL
jgi:BirA family biotin operon repressor/biotin-[acetyl-CoA-carboxylase] ligase